MLVVDDFVFQIVDLFVELARLAHESVVVLSEHCQTLADGGITLVPHTRELFYMCEAHSCGYEALHELYPCDVFFAVIPVSIAVASRFEDASFLVVAQSRYWNFHHCADLTDTHGCHPRICIESWFIVYSPTSRHHNEDNEALRWNIMATRYEQRPAALSQVDGSHGEQKSSRGPPFNQRASKVAEHCHGPVAEMKPLLICSAITKPSRSAPLLIADSLQNQPLLTHIGIADKE